MRRLEYDVLIVVVILNIWQDLVPFHFLGKVDEWELELPLMVLILMKLQPPWIQNHIVENKVVQEPAARYVSVFFFFFPSCFHFTYSLEASLAKI